MLSNTTVVARTFFATESGSELSRRRLRTVVRPRSQGQFGARRNADMPCLPPSLEGRKYYEPKERGFEKEIKRCLDGWEEIKKKRRP